MYILHAVYTSIDTDQLVKLKEIDMLLSVIEGGGGSHLNMLKTMLWGALLVWVRLQFTYYVINRGGGDFQMLTVDYGGGGGGVGR